MKNPPIRFHKTNTSSPDPFEGLSAYVDQQLSPQEQEALEEDLAQDPQMWEDYQRLLRLREGFQQLQHQDLAHLQREQHQSTIAPTSGQVEAERIAAIMQNLPPETPPVLSPGWVNLLTATGLAALGTLCLNLGLTFKPIHQFAQTSNESPETVAIGLPETQPPKQPTAELVVALDQPVFALPYGAMAPEPFSKAVVNSRSVNSRAY